MELTEATNRYLKYLRNIKNASKYTLRNYQKSLDLLLDVIGKDADISDITLNTIDDFRDGIFEKKNREKFYFHF